MRVETPSGGRHINFRMPPDVRLYNRAGDILPGLDIRATGGQVLAPGSARSDGKIYRQLGDADFDHLADAPDWLLFYGMFNKNTRERLAARGVLCAADFGDLPPARWAERARELMRPASTVSEPVGDLTEARKAALVKYVNAAVEGELDKLVKEAAEGHRDNDLQKATTICASLVYGLRSQGVEDHDCEENTFDQLCAAADQLGAGFGEENVRGKWERLVDTIDRGTVTPRDLSHVGLDAVERASADVEFADVNVHSEARILVKSATEMTLEAILDAERDPLVEGIFLRRGEQATLHAETTAGKTFLIIDLGFHLALEHLTKWHNRDVARVPVLCAVFEDTPGFEKRVAAAKIEFGDPGDWFMRIVVCGVPTGVIIIDTKIRAIAGDNEDKTEDAARYVEHRVGRIIKETGAIVITVSHPNRAGDERGSLVFRQADDVRLTVVRKAGRRTLVAEKVRNGEEGPIFDYRLKVHELGKNAKGKPITSCTIVKEDPSHVGNSEPKPKRSEVTLEAAFRRAQDDGKCTTDLLPTGQTPGLRAEASVIEASFKELYPATTPEAKKKAWQRVSARLPAGFETDEAELYVWKADAAFGVEEDED
jgi:bifunctional DNA primase/polymerase-like protein/AAA domain-containing protein